MARLSLCRRLGLGCVGMTFLLMVLGAWVKANGAGLSCPDWPSCYGAYFPPFPSLENSGTYQGHAVVYTQAQILYEWTHRAVVALIIVPVAAFALVAGTDKSLRPALRNLAMGAVAVYFLQAPLDTLPVVPHHPPSAPSPPSAPAVVGPPGATAAGRPHWGLRSCGRLSPPWTTRLLSWMQRGSFCCCTSSTTSSRARASRGSTATR